MASWAMSSVEPKRLSHGSLAVRTSSLRHALDPEFSAQFACLDVPEQSC